MKKFLTLTLVLFLSLFIVGESRGEIPNVILECKYDWAQDNIDLDMLSDDLADMYDIQGTTFIELNDQNIAKIYTFSELDAIEITIGTYKITEGNSRRTLYLQHIAGILTGEIDREYLIYRSHFGSKYYCDLIPKSKNIDEYVEEHRLLYQFMIFKMRSKQEKKNKI